MAPDIAEITDLTRLTERVIGLAIAVDRELGPGPLESAYEECLCFELSRNGIAFARQVPLPVVYEDFRLDCRYRMDILAGKRLIVELKSVDKVLPIHHAQMMTYLRLSGCRVGRLINFNSLMLKGGIKRFVL